MNKFKIGTITLLEIQHSRNRTLYGMGGIMPLKLKTGDNILDEITKLKEENQPYKECIKDCIILLRAYDSLDLGLCNMKGVRELNDPEIIHYETILTIEKLRSEG